MVKRFRFASKNAIFKAMDHPSRVVTRFAPSPTGNLHSGSYRTAIFAYLYARKHDGQFLLRIEDTDRERSTDEYKKNILDSLQWLGLDFDGPVTYQSDSVARHREVLEKLVADGHAYVSKEEAKDGSGVIKEIVRLKNPNIVVSFEDEIKGTVTMDTTDLGDFVIAKNMSEPIWHLAVVVDDFDQGVTHVIRGEDHVSNTPRQILIQRAIGAPTPVYAHLPLVLGLDKQKLSKRKGALAMTEYRDLGYLPEALLNMIAMVGWNPGTDQELFSKDELVAAFELFKVQKSPAAFNPEKLDWFNREYIKRLPSEAFWNHAALWLPKWTQEAPQHLEMLKKIEHLLRDRIAKFADVKALFEAGEFDYFFNEPLLKEEMLAWLHRSEKSDRPISEADLGKKITEAKKHLQAVREKLEGIEESKWNIEKLKAVLMPYAEAEGKGNVLWPLRVALSGREKSPDPFELMSILGKEKTLQRVSAV